MSSIPATPSIPVTPTWVASQRELESLCQSWRQQAAIAVDTEFMRSTTFYPQAALFQVGDGRGCYLIDPLSVEDFSPFRDLLLDPSVTKVMHSCSEDLEVFQTFLDLVPDPLFDTQLAAAFTGHGFSLGYAALVDAMLGVKIPKSETRSDWLQRPLSQSQLQYAAMDVGYLLVVYGLLRKQLREQGRLSWVEQDCAALVDQARAGSAPEEYYLKVKQAWRLDARQLAVLQQLAAWRECEARTRDLPRNRLVRENALLDMATQLPDQLQTLKRIEGIPPRVVKSDGEELLEVIAAVLQLPEAELPAPIPRPLPPAQGTLLKQLRACVQDVAGELGVAPEVLARKKDYEELIRSGFETGEYRLPPALQGWREQVIGEKLLNYVKKGSEPFF